MIRALAAATLTAATGLIAVGGAGAVAPGVQSGLVLRQTPPVADTHPGFGRLVNRVIPSLCRSERVASPLFQRFCVASDTGRARFGLAVSQFDYVVTMNSTVYWLLLT